MVDVLGVSMRGARDSPVARGRSRSDLSREGIHRACLSLRATLVGSRVSPLQIVGVCVRMRGPETPVSDDRPSPSTTIWNRTNFRPGWRRNLHCSGFLNSRVELKPSTGTFHPSLICKHPKRCCGQELMPKTLHHCAIATTKMFQPLDTTKDAEEVSKCWMEGSNTFELLRPSSSLPPSASSTQASHAKTIALSAKPRPRLKVVEIKVDDKGATAGSAAEVVVFGAV